MGAVPSVPYLSPIYPYTVSTKIGEIFSNKETGQFRLSPIYPYLSWVVRLEAIRVNCTYDWFARNRPAAISFNT